MSPPSDDGLRRDLARLVGAQSVVEAGAGAHYDHDQAIQRGLRGRADAVVCPEDPEGVERVLRYCYERGLPVVPRGGGTGLTGGATPVTGGVVLSVERLREIKAIEPELWRISVEAGVSTAQVARLARENGLLFAPDPGASEQSQIGGNVATNAGGPHAFKYGRTGAWVSGLQVVLAPGELATLGGAARRDAAGYDLTGLLVGSEGTLGVITAVELHLVPAPAVATPLVALLPDLAAGQAALLEILGNGLCPAVLDFLDGRTFCAAAGSFPGEVPSSVTSDRASAWVETARGAGDFGGDPGLGDAGFPFALLMELDGSEGEVAEQGDQLRELLGAQQAIVLEAPRPASLWRWRDNLAGVIAAMRGGKVSEDICVAPERLGEAIAGVYSIGIEHALPACAWGHAGDGILHASFLVDLSSEPERERATAAGEQALELALRLGGSITGEHGVGWVKRAHFGAGWDPATLAAHRRIKHAFDPRGLLNPGKKVPLSVERSAE
jgi:FAD/FMN-containing dehydrogenase